MKTDEPIAARLERLSLPEPTSGCSLWLGTPNQGYGALLVDGRPRGAHRFALELHLGRRLARHEYACHHCDNPRCIRVSHLFVGSSADNMRDAVRKGWTWQTRHAEREKERSERMKLKQPPASKRRPHPQITDDGVPPLLMVPQVQCQRCGHAWIPRKPIVYVCAKCHSPMWRVPKAVSR
jgi:DNA-directed RNA polymerase subunit RPC12/RpoP